MFEPSKMLGKARKELLIKDNDVSSSLAAKKRKKRHPEYVNKQHKSRGLIQLLSRRRQFVAFGYRGSGELGGHCCYPRRLIWQHRIILALKEGELSTIILIWLNESELWTIKASFFLPFCCSHLVGICCKSRPRSRRRRASFFCRRLIGAGIFVVTWWGFFTSLSEQ